MYNDVIWIELGGKTSPKHKQLPSSVTGSKVIVN